MVEYQKLVSKADYLGASSVEHRFLRSPKIKPQAQGVRVFEGDAGNWVGIRMKGGILVLKGSCGNEAGRGMLNGNLLISENSGEHTGNQMYGGCIFVGGTVESVGHKKRDYVSQGSGVVLAGRLNAKGYTPPGMWIITNHMRSNWEDQAAELVGRRENNLIIMDKGRLDIGRLVESASKKILPDSSEEEVYSLFTGLKKEAYSSLKDLSLDEMGRFIQMQAEGKNKDEFRNAMLAGINQLFEFRLKEDASARQKAENFLQRWI